MEINFIAHSLGGLIVRAALKYMPLFKKYFKTFISLCSPHFGYLHHTSQLVSTSLWVMNQLKKDPSLLELTLQDNTDLNVFFYNIIENLLIRTLQKNLTVLV